VFGHATRFACSERDVVCEKGNSKVSSIENMKSFCSPLSVVRSCTGVHVIAGNVRCDPDMLVLGYVTK
jgi:hypothetical protein